MLGPSQKSPDPRDLGSIRELPGVRFSFASSAYLSRYADLLEPIGLTPGRMVALSHLQDHPGCEQKALALHLGVNEASVMSLLNRLEGVGLIERRQGRNKRSNAIFLTPLGVERFNEALNIEADLAKAVFGWMEPDELVRFVETMDKIWTLARNA